MDTVKALCEQTTTGKLINNISSNFKKDGPSRRTVKYCEERLINLQLLFDKFSTLDAELIHVLPDNHPYRTKQFYKQVQNIFENTKKLLLEAKERAEPGISEEAKQQAKEILEQEVADESSYRIDNDSGDDAEDNTHELKIPVVTSEDKEQEKRYKIQMAKIRMISQNCKIVHGAKHFNKAYFELKVKQLSEAWTSFNNNHEQIIANATEADFTNQYFKNDVYEATQTEYESCIIEIHEKLQRDFGEPTTKDVRKTANIKLPTIEIPTFYGDYKQWTSFYGLFNKTVHCNDSLSQEEKMYYLLSLIRGQAAKLVNHLTISEDNYITAWNTLTARYEDKRLLASTHVSALLDLASLTVESANGLRTIHDTAKECLHAIGNLGVQTDHWGPLVIGILTRKLDAETHRIYESTIKNPKEIQTLKSFFDFLEARFQSLATVTREKGSKKVFTQSQQPQQSIARKTTHVATTKEPSCSFCCGAHDITSCKTFQNLSIAERTSASRTKALCRSCLQKYHGRYCRKRCNTCNGAHHTLLHDIEKVVKRPQVESPTKTILQTANRSAQSSILLATAMVKIRHNNEDHLVRLLIDPGSQATFITEDLANNLKLKRMPIQADIAGMGLTEAGTAHSTVEFCISPRFTSNFKLNVKAMVFKNITSNMPDKVIEPNNWNHTKNLIWADPTFYEPGPIDILLGADYYGQVIMPSLVKGAPNEPIAQQTKLGWILTGSTSVNVNMAAFQTMVITTNEIDNQLKKFWELEEINQTRALSKDENECEEHFTNSHVRLSDGSYKVRIPFNIDRLTSKPLGQSKKTAFARLLQVEKRLASNQELALQYQQFMDEYEALGHMKKAERINGDAEHYYLPHHAVMKEESSTTKLRVVFDASAKTSTGTSLNDVMLNGPTLQQDLFSIILRWRKHKYVYTADIEKMFRQIKVHEDDQNYQRILWRKFPGDQLQEYQLTTVTYGTTAATYLAVRTLQQLAKDEFHRYPIASEIALNDFYVDDLISGNDTIDGALEAQGQLMALLKCGGFNLRKWASNNQVLLEAVPIKLRNTGILEFKFDDTIKTLGLQWNPATDSFGFRISLPDVKNRVTTKRSLLSESSKIFDPLGWLAPVTVVAKLIMQELWIAGLSWDQSLPPILAQQWQAFKESLTSLELISIPRWISYDTQQALSLHGFCDASEKAYAAVVYARSIDKTGKINVTLVSSKTKVAPIKTILSLPRLELCAALLLTKLMRQINESLNVNEVQMSFWTDSMITLSWIRGHPHKYKTFVANRISEIQQQSNPAQWQHINTKENPADCASRGLLPLELKSNSLWWTGPKWLQGSSEVWPQQGQFSDEAALELRHVMTITSTTIVNPFGELIEKFSNINKIFRIICYCRRFITKCLKRQNINTSHNVNLMGSEIKKAREELCKIIQHEEFKREISHIQQNGSVSSKSNLLALTPFIDDQKLLRVGGRIGNSPETFETKHPIILPSNHRLTKLIIKDAHLSTLHGGTQLTLAFIRKRYWITNGRNRIRAEINKCIICHRFKATPKLQLMADLPQGRVTPSRPFTHTGVDYAGPIQVRVSKGRGTKAYKGYISVFVCFSTKAVHLEIVSDLTATAFVAAFKRFVARRGMCQHIYSDNGTNFVGARSILDKEMRGHIMQAIPELQCVSAKIGTVWHFIPPSAPHFGGLWEAAVKSMKYHLKRIIGESTLTYEELSTVITQIEACLNSRPLTTISADPLDEMILTPGHFLIGDSLLANPEPNLLVENIPIGQRWKLVQRMVQQFWKRWSTDYLSGLQQRVKWNQKQPEVKLDDIVWIKDNTLSPTRWPVGRIVELHPGQDNITRVVTIRNGQGVNLKRPVSKISILPIDNPEVSENKTSKTETRSRHICATSSIKLLPLFVLSLLTISSIYTETSASKASYNLTNFLHQPGLYFEHTGSVQFTNNQWKIIAYFNMTSYHSELTSYRTAVRKLGQLCFNSSNHNACSATTSQLLHILASIEQRDQMLDHGKKYRQKRGAINIIGNIASELFGTLDNRDAEHYEQEIHKSKENQEYLLQLIKNQTSIADSTLNLLKKNEAEMIHHWKIFSQQVDEHLNDIDNINRFNTMAIQVLMLMLNFKDVQQNVIEAVLNTNNKVVSTAILTPVRLMAEINKLTQHMPPDVVLPGHQNPDQTLILYQLMSCKGRLNEQYAIFELKLPLLTKEKYQLFKPIPFPTTNATFIQPSMDYLAISMHRDQYYMLSKYEFHHCKLIDTIYICILQHPIYTAQYNGTCELQLMTSANTNGCSVLKQIAHQKPANWIKLKNNNWLFSLEQPETAVIVCEEDVSTVIIPRNGKISLEKGCTLKAGSITLKSHKSFRSKIDLSFLPEVNLSINWTPSYHTTVLHDVPNKNEFRELHKKIVELQDASFKVSTHDVHHYTMTYIIVGFVVLGVIVYLMRIKRRPPPQKDYNLEAQENNE